MATDTIDMSGSGASTGGDGERANSLSVSQMLEDDDGFSFVEHGHSSSSTTSSAAPPTTPPPTATPTKTTTAKEGSGGGPSPLPVSPSVIYPEFPVAPPPSTPSTTPSSPPPPSTTSRGSDSGPATEEDDEAHHHYYYGDHRSSQLEPLTRTERASIQALDPEFHFMFAIVWDLLTLNAPLLVMLKQSKALALQGNPFTTCILFYWFLAFLFTFGGGVVAGVVSVVAVSPAAMALGGVPPVVRRVCGAVPALVVGGTSLAAILVLPHPLLLVVELVVGVWAAVKTVDCVAAVCEVHFGGTPTERQAAHERRVRYVPHTSCLLYGLLAVVAVTAVQALPWMVAVVLGVATAVAAAPRYTWETPESVVYRAYYDTALFKWTTQKRYQ